MGTINFLSFRELRASIAVLDEMLADDGKIIVTSNGKPKAVMLPVSEANFEETIALINQVKLTKAINNIRLSSLRCGASEMTLDEINAEIAQSRKERRQRLTQVDRNA